jgi:hypothetical protein
MSRVTLITFTKSSQSDPRARVSADLMKHQTPYWDFNIQQIQNSAMPTLTHKRGCLLNMERLSGSGNAEWSACAKVKLSLFPHMYPEGVRGRTHFSSSAGLQSLKRLKAISAFGLQVAATPLPRRCQGLSTEPYYYSATSDQPRPHVIPNRL